MVRSNVYYAEWTEPVDYRVHNFVVIGAGAGGLVASAGVADVGAKVALIEPNA